MYISPTGNLNGIDGHRSGLVARAPFLRGGTVCSGVTWFSTVPRGGDGCTVLAAVIKILEFLFLMALLLTVL